MPPSRVMPAARSARASSDATRSLVQHPCVWQPWRLTNGSVPRPSPLRLRRRLGREDDARVEMRRREGAARGAGGRRARGYAANDEGPLPWIERDYTPVSTAKEWERGTCDLLVKVYEQGAATSWLLREATLGREFLMSKPTATLQVPGLTPSGKAASFRPKSVLLMLAGTGVVALPQLLAHRDPVNKLGISTPRRDQMKDAPIDVLLSFREDDVLMTPELTRWCREGAAGPVSSPFGTTYAGVRHCTALLTPPVMASGAGVPFPNHPKSSSDADDAVASLAKFADVRRGYRLDANVVEAAVARMPPPCRVVVSGPSAFNGAAREYLRELMDIEKHVTILAA